MSYRWGGDDVDEGSIRVDGHDVRELSLSSLRGSIGYVSQEPFLFQGSVRENVAYGCRDVGEDEIVSAARRAGAYEFIRELPDGLDTTVGERGDHHDLLEQDGLYANLWRVHVGEVDDLPEEFVRAASRRADLND